MADTPINSRPTDTRKITADGLSHESGPAVPDLRIGMLPLDIAFADPGANLDKVGQCLKQHAGEVDLLLLPELFSTAFGRDLDVLRRVADEYSGSTVDMLMALSEKYGVAIAGSFLASEAGRYYNRGFLIVPGDDTPRFYDKHHLFSISAEGVLFTAGEKPIQVIEYMGWNVGLAVCYDLRFPAWCRFSFDCKPYDVLMIAANWPSSRLYPWEHLLIARAIENQAYVVACDRSGNDDFGNYDHMSRAYDYTGIPIDTRMCGSIQMVTLQYDPLNDWRHRWPFVFDADSIIVR